VLAGRAGDNATVEIGLARTDHRRRARHRPRSPSIGHRSTTAATARASSSSGWAGPGSKRRMR
jgi:hypothetical protein